MNRPSNSGSKRERFEFALKLADLGDLDGAADALEEAIALDPRNLDLKFALATIESERGEIDISCRLLTELLATKPTYPEAAARLSRHLARFKIEDLANLNPGGLRAAMLATGISRQPLVDVTLDWLVEFDPTLSSDIARIESGEASERDVARPLVAEKTAEGLSAGLLLLCLRSGLVRRPALERHLTGIRAAIMLDCPASRFEDRSLFDVALSLVTQGWLNDHAWHETPDEIAALNALDIDRSQLLDGDRQTIRNFVCAAMYRPVDALLGAPLRATDVGRLRPRSLREAIEPLVREQARQHVLASKIPALKPLADATSLKVAGQYEAAPYPRWTTLHVSRPGDLKRSLARMVPVEHLAFMDGAYDVLVAGCGTGQQVLQSATAYGPAARISAMDLSRASLAYAADKAADLKIQNVSFVQGDILDAALLGKSFDIIECVGVLHHMAEWRTGWAALLQQLRSQGLMYVGLYSATSRANIAALRSDPANPGPGCSDAAARSWRRELMLRADDAAGGTVKTSNDFYALAAFRDLMLHESEAHVTLEEIAAFLDQNNLEFRGFTLEPSVIADFQSATNATGANDLAAWSAYEQRHPRTFDAMYRFWVKRRA